jgi:hypothetical protein
VADSAELVQTTDGSRRPSSQDAHCQHKGEERACRDNDHDHDASKIRPSSKRINEFSSEVSKNFSAIFSLEEDFSFLTART